MTSPSTPAPYLQPALQQERWNVLAVVGFVLAFFVSLGAVVCGHIALAQIKRTGERGHGLALAAVILGYAGIALGLLWIVVVIVLLVASAASGAYHGVTS